MKINIILITYNQAAYIRQTMDSIVSQQTQHDVEIIVADDCSSDNTLGIIEEYSKHCNFTFTYLHSPHNMGYVRNYQRAFAACSGKYIAIMEGDDLWTSPKHLQQHIDFLEQHAECSMSFNRHLRFFEDRDEEEIPAWDSDKDYEYITTGQMIGQNRIGNLSCCVFRTELIQKLDQTIFDIEFADWLLGMIMGQYGYLAHLKEITSTYRIHDNGQWSRMTEQEQAVKMIEMLKLYRNYVNDKYAQDFAGKIKSLEICLYGDNTPRGFLKKLYKTIFR